MKHITYILAILLLLSCTKVQEETEEPGSLKVTCLPELAQCIGSRIDSIDLGAYLDRGDYRHYHHDSCDLLSFRVDEGIAVTAFVIYSAHYDLWDAYLAERFDESVIINTVRYYHRDGIVAGRFVFDGYRMIVMKASTRGNEIDEMLNEIRSELSREQEQHR